MVCEADTLPGTPISRQLTAESGFMIKSTLDSDVLLNPGSRKPCLSYSDQANISLTRTHRTIDAVLVKPKATGYTMSNCEKPRYTMTAKSSAMICASRIELSRGRSSSWCRVVLIQKNPLSLKSGSAMIAMDFVIPVALGELLTEKYILIAEELNRHRAKALAPSQATIAWTADR